MTELVTPQAKCDPSDRVTNSLLGYGVIAGPVYVVVSLAQALTRDGFDLSRHQWSLLANGTGGWIQVTNFIACGLMLLAMAVGVRRALGHGRGAKWAPRLIGVFGLSLITAAVFRADPALGFPTGAPEGAASVSVNGVVHFAAGGIGFACVAAACFVLARRYTVDGRGGWARLLTGHRNRLPGGLRLCRLRRWQRRGELAVHRRRGPGLHLDHGRLPGPLTGSRPHPRNRSPLTEPVRITGNTRQ